MGDSELLERRRFLQAAGALVPVGAFGRGLEGTLSDDSIVASVDLENVNLDVESVSVVASRNNPSLQGLLRLCGLGEGGLYDEYCDYPKRAVLLDIVSRIANHACSNYRDLVTASEVPGLYECKFPDTFTMKEEFFSGIPVEEKEKLWKEEREIEIVNDAKESGEYPVTTVSTCPFELGVRVRVNIDKFSPEVIFGEARRNIAGLALGEAMARFYFEGHEDDCGVDVGIKDGWNTLRADSRRSLVVDGIRIAEVTFPFTPEHMVYSGKE